MKKLEKAIEERDNQLKGAIQKLERAEKNLLELQESHKEERKLQEEIITKLRLENQQLKSGVEVITKVYSNTQQYII